MTLSCSSCLCFERHQASSETGLCHRFPPVPMAIPGQPLGFPYWPIVHERAWCWEHIPKEEEPPKPEANGQPVAEPSGSGSLAILDESDLPPAGEA